MVDVWCINKMEEIMNDALITNVSVPVADFEKHSGSWILWPERSDVWRNNAEHAQKAFAKVANALVKHEKVYIGINTNVDSDKINILDPGITIVKVNYNDAWIRDIAPTFIKNNQDGKYSAIKWQFNAWGEVCYCDWTKDNQFGRDMSNYLKIPFKEAPIILEGGTFVTDNVGTIIINKNCIIDEKRNPGLTITEAEDILKNYLNVKKIIWIEEGVFGDETGGHVDNICNFIKPKTIAMAWTDDTNDPQYPLSMKLYERLVNETDANGDKFDIHKIPLPSPIYITEEEAKGIEKKEGTLIRKAGTRLAASYINFYIGNKCLLVPTFNDKKDEEVLNTFRNHLPEKEVIGIYSKEILLGGGNIHCIVMYNP